MTDQRVPVTLLTGFLGSGKTTLLNAVLSDTAAGRVAVIVNEFGDAGLDHDLIEESSDEIVLMRSGCLCCSVRGDLTKTMAGLLVRRDHGEIEFERVVIETTGLADPGPILQTFIVDKYLAHHTRIDGVVTLADAVNGPATLDVQVEAVSQAAMADLIVLSKTDLVAPPQVEAFEARLRVINPGVRILRALRGKGISAHIWGLTALKPEAKKNDVLGWTIGFDTQPDPFANLSRLSPITPTAPQPLSTSTHTQDITTASIILEDPVSDAVFDRWLDTLIALKGPDILRVKGIVFLEGMDTPFVFHGVQHIFDPPVKLKEWPKDDHRSRIVVIARNLSEPELQRSFDMLRAHPQPMELSQ